MGEIRKERQEKMNRNKFYKVRKAEIRKIHKNTKRLADKDLYHMECDLEKDYFPTE